MVVVSLALALDVADSVIAGMKSWWWLDDKVCSVLSSGNLEVPEKGTCGKALSM